MAKIVRYPCHNLSVQTPLGHEDALWENVPAQSLCDVVTGEQPFLATSFQIFRDDRLGLLFVRFQGEDDAIHSSFKLLDEPLYRQDVFELFLAEEGDLLRYKELEVSPWDVHFDGQISCLEDGSRRLDCSWDVQAWHTDTNYEKQKNRLTSLWALPYTAFAERPAPGKSWRFNAFRIDHSVRGISLQAWQETGEADFHKPDRFGYLDFEA
jgi:hypothetical protein